MTAAILQIMSHHGALMEGNLFKTPSEETRVHRGNQGTWRKPMYPRLRV